MRPIPRCGVAWLPRLTDCPVGYRRGASWLGLTGLTHHDHSMEGTHS